MAAAKKRDHFWVLAAIGVLAIVAVTVGLILFTRASDENAKNREEVVVRNGLRARIHEIEAQVVPQAVWDDAVQNLDNAFDYEWARENIGLFLTNVDHFRFAFVIGADNRALYGIRDGKDLSLAAPVAELSAAKNVISHVRARENAKAGATKLQNIVQSSATERADGRLYIVTATLVQSDFGHARIEHEAAPIVVTGREMDDDFMATFGDRYLLRNLHLHESDSGHETAEAHTFIHGDDGKVVGTLDWTPQTQGARLLASILPWMLGLFALMLAATLGLYARGRRSDGRLLAIEKQTLHMAYHDALTGLSNRANLEKMLGNASSVAANGNRPFALHLIDLDRFKDLNDTHGHHVGDEALKAVTRRLATLCGAESMCARLGGDEFAVLQEPANADSASALAQQIINSLIEPFSLSVGTRMLGCSVGIALSGDEKYEPVEMLRRADMALYRAKAEGRGCFRLFDDEMDRAFKATGRLKEDLKADILAGKLQMVYQPQVRLSGEVVGLEALARWTHAADGPIPPSVFVPLAEEVGLITELGEFSLRRAAEDSKLWPGLTTAVNVSATQLQHPGFVERACEIIRDVGVDPRAIEIELTEGVLLSNDAHVRAALDALHEAGFTIALDDFGTGYSSLSYLPQFPIDKIKIDRSFVTLLGRDKKADALFTAIVRLAQALDMRVIAEGVENREQWLRLSAAGCPKIQGYIASPPLDANGAAAFIERAGASASSRMPLRPNALPVLWSAQAGTS